jgi:hypothetical protein
MESDAGRDPLRQQLREIERGESASWVVYPPTPAWWPIGAGAWAGAYALVVALLDGASRSLALLGLVALVLLAMAWDRRRRGTYPTGRPPRELRRAIAGMVLGAVAVAALAWLVGEQVGAWAAAAVAALGAWAVVTSYERAYAGIAARVRERLA